MRTWILYSVTMIVELISVGVRFVLVAAPALLFVEREWAVLLGALAGLAPLIASLIVLAGVPSGHGSVRRRLRARALTPAEQARLDHTLQPIRAQGISLPKRIFTVPESGLNAAVSGRTLYIFEQLYASRYLPGVVAHELGHYHSLDGRMLLALRTLTIPGGFLIVYVLLQILRWAAYGLSLVLSGLLIVLFTLFRLRLAGPVGAIFRILMTFLRMLIIFAVGGVGPALLGSFWRSHFIEREYAADAYAARLGYADDLIDFFARHELMDVSIPWYEHPTHPPSSRRIAQLRKISTAASPRNMPRTGTASRPMAVEPTLSAVAPAPAPAVYAAYLPALAAGLVAFLLIGTLLWLRWQSCAAPDLPVPPLGPTPTLGVPGL